MADTTFTLDLSIKKSDIAAAYHQKLKQIQQQIKIQGFRPGKAPLELVEQQVDQDQIIKDIANPLITQAFQNAIKKQKLKPIVNPQIETVNPPLTITKDWQFKATSCQLPLVKLSSTYKTKIKKINSNKKIKKEQLINNIFESLLTSAQIDFPPVLINSEIEKKIDQLANKLKSANVSLDSFLSQQNTKLEDFIKNLEIQIKKDWTLNLTINHIAETEKLTASQEEINDLISKNPHLSQNPNLAFYLIEQQKVVNFLKKL